MNPDELIKEYWEATKSYFTELYEDHFELEKMDKRVDDTYQALRNAFTELQALTTWLPYPENTPTVGETYNVLRHCPDGWDYHLATYRPDLTLGWFSEINACPLRYVTHFAPLLPLPEK